MLRNTLYYPCMLRQSVFGSLRVFPFFIFFGKIPEEKKSCHANRKIKTAWPKISTGATRVALELHSHTRPW
jgi:hypothetical protein